MCVLQIMLPVVTFEEETKLVVEPLQDVRPRDGDGKEPWRSGLTVEGSGRGRADLADGERLEAEQQRSAAAKFAKRRRDGRDSPAGDET